MKKVAQLVHEQELSVEERNLLSVSMRDIRMSSLLQWVRGGAAILAFL